MSNQQLSNNSAIVAVHHVDRNGVPHVAYEYADGMVVIRPQSQITQQQVAPVPVVPRQIVPCQVDRQPDGKLEQWIFIGCCCFVGTAGLWLLSRLLFPPVPVTPPPPAPVVIQAPPPPPPPSPVVERRCKPAGFLWMGEDCTETKYWK